MITHGKELDVQVQNIQGVQDMGLKVTAKSFALLIDKLYTRKECAVVRELAANARDAMVDSGQPQTPFEIHLPNTICHELIVRDNGTGLSKEDVHKYLGNLFESSKEQDNSAIGAYGLGSKSPFAVTDSYIIESRFNGEMHSFSFFRSKGGTPQLVHISTFPTDEPNGITFKVPSSVGRYDEYAKSVAAQLYFFEPKPIVYGRGDQQHEIWDDYGKTLLEGSNWKMVQSHGMKSYYGRFIANMGGINYPIDIDRLSSFDSDDDFLKDHDIDPGEVRILANQLANLNNICGNTTCFALFFNIGDLEIPPSREMIEYDAETCYHIIEGLKKFTMEFGDKFANYIKENADGSSATKLQESLTRLCGIIDWDLKSNEWSNTTRPEIGWLHDKIMRLSWDIEINKQANSYHGRGGKLVGKTVSVGPKSPRSISKTIDVDFPHVKKTRTLTNRWSFRCNPDGSVNGGLVPVAPEQFKGWNETKREVRETMGDHQMVVSVEKEEEYWDPCYQVSDDVKPSWDIVTAKNPSYSNITHINQNKQMWDSDDLIIFHNDDKKDIRRHATWAIRLKMGMDRGLTDHVDMLSEQPGRFRGQVYIIKADKNDFAWIESYIDSMHSKPKIMKLSDLVVPKSPVVTTSNLSIRGVKRLLVNVGRLNLTDNIDEMHGRYNDNTFTSIPSSVKSLDAGYLLFNDGQTEKTYFDPEFKFEADLKTLVKLLAAKGRMCDQESFYIYRITPMNIKNLDKFLNEGFSLLKDEILSAGLDLCGRNQFKRRYKHFLLSYAYTKTSDFNVNARRWDDYTASSSIKHFADKNELKDLRVGKYIDYAIRSYTKPGHSLRDSKRHDVTPILSFAWHYGQTYGKMKPQEAWRILIDSCFLEWDNFKYIEKLFDIKKNRVLACEAGRIMTYSQAEFIEYRKQYVKQHFKQVLFGDDFNRDSEEFNSALEEAKKHLR